MGNISSSPALWSTQLKPNNKFFRSLRDEFLQCHYFKHNRKILPQMFNTYNCPQINN